VFDGFYVERPFHWGGAFSIFDPKMIESAQLSHGVFSARWGHTISGILDIRAKHPTAGEAGVDLAVSTSATNLNLTIPLGEKGGAAVMGKVTYWDPFVEFAKLFFEEVRYVTTAPYIRSGTLAAHYAFTSDLDATLNGFFGGDGVGGHYDDPGRTADASYDNKIGFITGGINFHPSGKTLLKTRIGVGLLRNDTNISIQSVNTLTFQLIDKTINAQLRFDMDHDLGGGLLLAAGIEGRFNQWNRGQERYSSSGFLPIIPLVEFINRGINSAIYALLEYKPEDSFFSAELGLRGNHFFLFGDNGDHYTFQSLPTLDPRLNLDFQVLEDRGLINSLTVTVGSGLFSTLPNGIQNITKLSNLGYLDMKQSRSWTNLVGTKIDFLEGWSFSLEGYFKYVFNRGYNLADISPMGINFSSSQFAFDGESVIWGFDCMLQKFESRYIDGWISYSFINARYRDPQLSTLPVSDSAPERNNGGWYYPSFHRFHTLNIIANYKPVQQVQLTTRFSFATGIPLLETVDISPNSTPPPNYSREQAYSDSSRMGFVIPLDIKLSFFKYARGKVRREIYINFENLLSLVYRPKGMKDFDSDTGNEVTGISVASYDLPIPLITFGIKWSY
jgi:hypothetical protein